MKSIKNRLSLNFMLNKTSPLEENPKTVSLSATVKMPNRLPIYLDFPDEQSGFFVL